jgi:C1A family cysteine protease
MAKENTSGKKRKMDAPARNIPADSSKGDGNDVIVLAKHTGIGDGNDVPVLLRRHPVGAPAFPYVTPNPKLSARTVKRYGWRRDLPDPRDHLYAAPLALSLPPTYDLRSFSTLPPVYDQGDLGSCTANAIAAAIQFERSRQKLPSGNLIPSRLFIYYNERTIEGTVGSDSGAEIRDGIKSVASQGDCFEEGKNAWPYVVADFNDKPRPACYKAALKDRVVSYSRLIQSLDQMRGCLASGYPFVCGFTVFPAFESKDVARTGTVPMPATGERAIGGHAVMAVGYDDNAQRFTVRNSWGVAWGREGYFTIPYAYLTSSSLASDFWTIRLISPSAAK